MTTSTTVLTSVSTAAAGPLSTVVVSPVASSMMFVVATCAGFGAPGNFTVESGAFTFTETPSGGISLQSGLNKLSVWRSSVGSTPGSSTVTISNSLNDAKGYGVQVIQITGLNTDGVNGASSVAQSQASTIAGGNPDTFTNILTGYTPGNPVFAAFSADNPGSWSGISPYAEVLQQGSVSNGNGSLETVYLDPGTSSQPATFSVAFADLAVIALELQAAPTPIQNGGYYLQEDGVSKFTLEDGSGFYLIESWTTSAAGFITPPFLSSNLSGLGSGGRFFQDRNG